MDIYMPYPAIPSQLQCAPTSDPIMAGGAAQVNQCIGLGRVPFLS